jgi:hypothetical protein
MPPASAIWIPDLSPVLETSGTGLGSLVTVPDWIRHRHYFSFLYLNDKMQDNPEFKQMKR